MISRKTFLLIFSELIRVELTIFILQIVYNVKLLLIRKRSITYINSFATHCVVEDVIIRYYACSTEGTSLQDSLTLPKILDRIFTDYW